MRTNLIRRERKIGYRLVSVIRCGNFCYNATTMGLSLNERILSTAIVRHCYCRFLAASDTERPSSRNPAHANSSEFSSVLDANQGFKTSQNSPGISLIASAPLGSEKRFVFSSLLSLFGIRITEFCNCIFKVLNFVCCIFNRSGKNNCAPVEKIVSKNTILLRFHQKLRKDTKENGFNGGNIDIPSKCPVLANKLCRNKNLSQFHAFLRGLISNLSLATKFYSSSRRPLPIVF